MLDFYFVRHAESLMNRSPQLIGGRSSSSPLSSLGVFQAGLLGERLSASGVSFDQWYASTAVRAYGTASLVASRLGVDSSVISRVSQLEELSQGDWEGKFRSDCYTPEVLGEIGYDRLNFSAPGGESQRDVELRMLSWLDGAFLSSYDSSVDLSVGVFSHGLAIKCMLRGIMDFSPHFTYHSTLDNTSLTRLRYDSSGWHLLSFNDTGHLFQKGL